MLILQILSLITLFYFVNTFNILTVWYLAGIYLVLLGWWLLLDDGDIFVGFLWVIDLGVGLIFFMFILHYSTFLHQKSNVNKTSREFSFTSIATITIVSIFSFISSPVEVTSMPVLSKIWFFSVSWYGCIWCSHKLLKKQKGEKMNLLKNWFYVKKKKQC